MLVAITMVKDEADIIGYTIEHLLAQGVDKIICYDNMSTDETPRILDRYHPKVQVFADREYGYYQADKISRLARNAYYDSADWVLPFDADELIYPTDQNLTLATFFATRPYETGIINITGYDYLPRPDMPDQPNPYLQFEWRRENSQTYPKVAFRAHQKAEVHMGNHGVSHIPGETHGGLTLAHIQYRSYDQMCRKLRNGKAVYDATDLDGGQGTHWRTGGGQTDQQMADQWAALTVEPAIHDPIRVPTWT